MRVVFDVLRSRTPHRLLPVALACWLLVVVWYVHTMPRPGDLGTRIAHPHAPPPPQPTPPPTPQPTPPAGAFGTARPAPTPAPGTSATTGTRGEGPQRPRLHQPTGQADRPPSQGTLPAQQSTQPGAPAITVVEARDEGEEDSPEAVRALAHSLGQQHNASEVVGLLAPFVGRGVLRALVRELNAPSPTPSPTPPRSSTASPTTSSSATPTPSPSRAFPLLSSLASNPHHATLPTNTWQVLFTTTQQQQQASPPSPPSPASLLSVPAVAVLFESRAQDLDFDFGAGGPGNGSVVDWFEMSAIGVFEWGTVSPASVVHARADDHVRVWVDGLLVVDMWEVPDGLNTAEAVVELEPSSQPSLHTVRVMYRERTGDASVAVWFTPTCVDCFIGRYYHGVDFFHLVALRIDARIDFDWPDRKSPHPAVFHDQFSCRWDGHFHFSTPSMQRFCMEGDDGLRLIVDGDTKLSRWDIQPTWAQCLSVAVPAGAHHIRVEHFDASGAARAVVRWDAWKDNVFTCVVQSSTVPTSVPVSAVLDTDQAFELPPSDIFPRHINRDEPVRLSCRGQFPSLSPGLYRMHVTHGGVVVVAVDGRHVVTDRIDMSEKLRTTTWTQRVQGANTLISLDVYTVNSATLEGTTLTWAPHPAHDFEVRFAPTLAELSAAHPLPVAAPHIAATVFPPSLGQPKEASRQPCVMFRGYETRTGVLRITVHITNANANTNASTPQAEPTALRAGVRVVVGSVQVLAFNAAEPVARSSLTTIAFETPVEVKVCNTGSRPVDVRVGVEPFTVDQGPRTSQLLSSLAPFLLPSQRQLPSSARIFVVPLPPQFNVGLLNAFPFCRTAAHSADAWLHSRLLASSIRTTDRTKASLFFLPVYLACAYESRLLPSFPSPSLPWPASASLRDQAAHHTSSLLADAIAQWPLFDEVSGARHIVPLTHSEGACILGSSQQSAGILRNALVLTGRTSLTGNTALPVAYSSCVNPLRDVAVPMYTHDQMITKIGQGGSNINAENRRLVGYLFQLPWQVRRPDLVALGARGDTATPTFATKLGHTWRSRVEFRIQEHVPPQSLARELANAQHCVCPGGEFQSVWPGCLVEAILMGCMPLFVDSVPFLPFQNTLNYTQFAQFISSDSTAQVSLALLGVSAATRAQMQAALGAVWGVFAFDHTLAAPDVADMALVELGSLDARLPPLPQPTASHHSLEPPVRNN